MVLPIVPPPPDDALLWRYTNFTKFVAMLSTKSLYFTRADAFPDKFEGAKGTVLQQEKYDTFYRNQLREMYLTKPETPDHEYTPGELEERVLWSLTKLHDAGKWQRTTTFINCWHEAEHESEAMWSLYAGWRRSETENPGSIAMVSTFAKLRDAVSTAPTTYVGRIQYIDYSKQLTGLNEAFWHKSKSFEHEKEVRAITHRYGFEELGVQVGVDIDALVSHVRMSPLCPTWLEELVKDVSAKYGHSFEIRRSSLEDMPFY